MCDFDEGEYVQSNIHFGRGLLLVRRRFVDSHKEQMSLLMILVLF